MRSVPRMLYDKAKYFCTGKLAYEDKIRKAGCQIQMIDYELFRCAHGCPWHCDQCPNYDQLGAVIDEVN